MMCTAILQSYRKLFTYLNNLLRQLVATTEKPNPPKIFLKLTQKSDKLRQKGHQHETELFRDTERLELEQ